MADVITPPTAPIDAVTPPVTPDAVAPVGDTGGGLPSAQAEIPKLNFELTDIIKEKYLSNDKLLAKYDNLEQLVEAHKHLQDKHAQYVEDVKNNEKNINGDVASQHASVKKMETIKSLLPDYLANNMELTPELEAKLVEADLDIRDVKLSAIELKERITKAYDTVGGQDNYAAMMGWATANLTDSQKTSFDADITSGMSEFAIKGLYGDYQKAQADGNATPPPRVTGDSNTRSIDGYPDRQSLLKDKAYIDSVAGKRDKAAVDRYRQRLALTAEVIWRGY